MITITSKHLERWGLPGLIPEEQLPMEVMRVFEAPISPSAKVWLLLHEEILGGRGMVYVGVKAARRACTETGWNHPNSLRALDLCDRFASGEEISKEERDRAAKAAFGAARAASRAEDASKAAWVATIAATIAAYPNNAVWSVTCSANAVAWDTNASKDEERKSQLTDCREWLLRRSPSVPVLTRYQRIMRSL